MSTKAEGKQKGKITSGIKYVVAPDPAPVVNEAATAEPPQARMSVRARAEKVHGYEMAASGIVSGEAAIPIDSMERSLPEWLATGIGPGASVGSAKAREISLAKRLVADVAKNSSDVNTLCETYGLRREELGRLTGFSLRALAEWASGKLPSQPAKRRLHEVRRLLDALGEIVNLESIPRWLHEPNPAFDRLTPLQVIEVGEMDRLWAMVYDLGSGQPG